jgi:hypothetical protein
MLYPVELQVREENQERSIVRSDARPLSFLEFFAHRGKAARALLCPESGRPFVCTPWRIELVAMVETGLARRLRQQSPTATSIRSWAASRKYGILRRSENKMINVSIRAGPSNNRE